MTMVGRWVGHDGWQDTQSLLLVMVLAGKWHIMDYFQNIYDSY